MQIGRFLALASGIARALGGIHQHGLIHKDVKPAKIVVNWADGHVRLTGSDPPLDSRVCRDSAG
jgi:serine/threonine protein kinase